jgi:uncharacterized protein
VSDPAAVSALSSPLSEDVFHTPHSTAPKRRIAEHGLCLLTEVGSTMHGVTVKVEDDMDEMGIAIAPPQVELGVKPSAGALFDQYEFRTKPVGQPSGPGDIDRTVYSLRKYVRLAAQGNPTVLMALFSNESHLRYLNWVGIELRGRSEMFLSKQAGARFLGYLNRQRQRISGELSPRTHRRELVEKYGYDSKYGYHALRLAIQGAELMTDHVITLPMRDDVREYLRDVRKGRYTEDEVLAQLDSYTQKLVEATGRADLPDRPKMPAINEWLAATILQFWERKRADDPEYFTL